MRIPTCFFLFSALCLPLLHCGGDDSSGDPGAPPGSETKPIECTAGPSPTAVAGFSRTTVDAALTGPSFLSIGDMNGDGKSDLVLSEFGNVSTAQMTLSPGRISVYYQAQDLNCWQKAEIVTEKDGFFFPNQTSLVDVDKDGDLDVIMAAGFFVCGFLGAGDCGALSWFENAGEGAWTPHEIVAKGAERFYHGTSLVDMDGDGVDDLVTVGETSSGAQAQWFKGDVSPERFGKTPLVIGDGLGSFPDVLDIDGDGDLDVASAEYFVAGGAFAWFEQTAPATFTRHVINSDSSKSIMFRFVPDLYGDGKLRGVGSNHTNTTTMKTPPDPESGVFVFDIPADPKELWPKTQISTGIVSRPSVGVGYQAAPGIFGPGDVDGDGDIDIAVSGDGDARTYWLEQTAPGAFSTHVIEESLGQAGGAQIADLDGDGKNEVVFAGFEDNVLYVYQYGK